MGLFKKKQELLLLSQKDLDSFDEMVIDQIGSYESVFHEIASPDLHIDVIIVPPSQKKDYITLVTMGMSAYPMPVTSKYGKMNRAEIAIRLPKDWDIFSKEEKWYWPIRMLKMLARMPYLENTWLGVYHTIDFGESFSKETEMCGVILEIFDENIDPLTYENGDQLILYNAIPIYRSEMEYKYANDGNALIKKMDEETVQGPLNIHRVPVV